MTTKHNHAPRFGRKFNGCPRCDELKAGAEPVTWSSGRTERGRVGSCPTNTEVSNHFAPGGPHERGVCGPVCTFGDW
ncbi:hypothetical protein ABTY20_19060 [Streptomyces sp. NPDC126497]|uniref:hypothetical protein n=1 Tax=Streptomyces sp. NPDC126497 TaxID=3155313 RepID=UPI003319C6B3